MLRYGPTLESVIARYLGPPSTGIVTFEKKAESWAEVRTAPLLPPSGPIRFPSRRNKGGRSSPQTQRRPVPEITRSGAKPGSAQYYESARRCQIPRLTACGCPTGYFWSLGFGGTRAKSLPPGNQAGYFAFTQNVPLAIERLDRRLAAPQGQKASQRGQAPDSLVHISPPLIEIYKRLRFRTIASL